MHECITIDPKWLIELAPRWDQMPCRPCCRCHLSLAPLIIYNTFVFRFFKQADSSKLSKRKMMEKIEPLCGGDFCCDDGYDMLMTSILCFVR